ncbi:hypothetical protein D3C87_1843870 [compost metagenome]
MTATPISPDHWLHCATALRTTKSVIWEMMPISSASGMNVVGAMAPSSGWVQRASASQETTLRLSISSSGWNTRVSASAATASRRSVLRR